MAEEINMSEQETGTEASDLSTDLSFLENAPNLLPAKPDAIDIYSNAVGNPITGSNPAAKTSNIGNSTAVKSIIDRSDKQSATSTNPYASMRPYTYSGDYDAANFERYHSTGSLYNKLGFSPYRDNESLYNDNMTFGDQFVRAAKQWDNLVTTGFMSGLRSWKTIFTDPLAPDIESAREMERAMAIGSSNAGGLGGFVTNQFLNMGYTIGIGADFLAEELALAAVTGLSGGLASEVTLPAMFTKAGSLFGKAKGIERVNQAENILSGAQNATRLDGFRKATEGGVNGARSFWSSVQGAAVKGAKSATGFFVPLENTIDALRATDYATDYAKVAKTFGAFADDLLMLKGTVSEAKLEGGMSKLTVTKELIDEYVRQNGKDPEGEELTRIENIANEEAYRTAFWNLPAIALSNKFMYATMLAPLKKVLGKADSAKLVDDYIFNNKTFEAVGDGFLSRSKAAAKSLAQPKFYGKFGMNYLKANLAEGVQENLQEAISKGASEHAMALFKDPIRAGYEGYMPHFMKGLKEQFSAQGAETFAGGFLMGAFAQPIMAAPSVGISKLIDVYKTQTNAEYKALKDLRELQKQETVNTLNEAYKDRLGILAPDIANAVRTGRLADDMFTAARNGHKRDALDAKDALQNHHLMTVMKNGKLDILIKGLADYKNLTKEEAVEAFGKYGVGAEDVDKAMAQIDGVIARSKTVQKNYEDAANQYPNPFNPAKFKRDTPDRIAAENAKAAWDEAVYNYVFAKATYDSTAKRVADIADTFSAVSSKLAGTSAQSMMSLLDSEATTMEMNTLRKEISTLDESIPEQRKVKKDKQEQLAKLTNFYEAIASIKFARTDQEKTEGETKAKEAFDEYVGYLAGKAGNIVFNQSLEQAYTLIKDSMLLKSDMGGLAKTINVLSTPDNFFDLHKRLNSAYDSIFGQQADILMGNQNDFWMIKDYNDLLNKIKAETGLDVPDELLEKYVEAHATGKGYPVPEYFLDRDGNKVTSGEEFDNAMSQWETFTNITRKEPTDEAEADFNEKDFSTYPESLVELLRSSYDNLSEDQKTLPFEEWAVLPEQAPMRRMYFQEFIKEPKGVIEDKYKAMTTEELSKAIVELRQQARKDASLDPLIKQLEDYLSYKTMRDKKLPAKQQAAIDKLKKLASTTEDRVGEDGKYVIDGRKKDYRVTELIYNHIMPNPPFNVSKFTFSEEVGKGLMNIAKKLFKEGKEKGRSNKAIINEWVAAIEGYQTFLERFDENKINKIKANLKDTEGYEEFEVLVNKEAYDESTIAGNTVDNLIRNFLEGTPLKKPSNMTDAAFENVRTTLHTMMDDITRRGDIILGTRMILPGEIKLNGETKTIGGEMDIIVVSPEGVVSIYDIKTGKKGTDKKKGKWEKYGTDDDKFKSKEAYTLQLSFYAALLKANTGLEVDRLMVIPFEVEYDLKGNITSLNFVKDKQGNIIEKNIRHTYNPLVEKYVVKGAPTDTIAKPFVVGKGATQSRLTEEEVKRRKANVEFINNKIVLLMEQDELLSSDVDKLEDTISYLKEVLNNSLSIADVNLKQIQDKINGLLTKAYISRPGSQAAATRAVNRLGEIPSLKEQYKSELELANDLLNTINDLKAEIEVIKGVQEDLNRQAEYYDALLSDPSLKLLDRQELTTKRDGMRKFLTSLNKTLDALRKAVADTIKYLKTHLESMFTGERKLRKFVNQTGFTTLTREEINKLMNSNLEDDAVFLENYPKLKEEFDRLENEVAENLDAAEWLEETQVAEEQRLDNMIKYSQKYQTELRYVEELVDDFNEEAKRLEKLRLEEAKQKQNQPKAKATASKKKLTFKQIIKDLEQDKKKQGTSKDQETINKLNEIKKLVETEELTPELLNEVFNTLDEKAYQDWQMSLNQNSLAQALEKLTKPGMSEKDAGKAISKYLIPRFIDSQLAALGAQKKETKKATTQEKKEVNIEDLNTEINLESLKYAKLKNFLVVYQGKTYKVKKIGKNSVILTMPNKTIEVPQKNFDELAIVEKGDNVPTKKDNTVVKNNAEVIKTTKRVYKKAEPLVKLKENFLNNLCKKI